LWHNDIAGNTPKLGLGCFGKLMVEIAKGRMESIGGGSPLYGMVDFSR
jgi:hypothetical protein